MSGSVVWIPVTDSAAWARAVVETDPKGATVKVKRVDNGAVVELSAAEFAEAPMENSVDTVPLEDLTQLADVHDATMLDTLRRRYAEDLIYTAIGPVIISINPYKKVGGCTSEAISNLCKLGEGAPPHVARAATVAYNGMTGKSTEGETRAQSILISGESGAGKTEACKLCLLALAELSGSSGKATEAALESSELLEAFGNAKTVYNDNSSRFGKWCAVHFDTTPHIANCQMEVYLLEKTRVIGPNPGERNYHVFYQMLKGASAGERELLQLEHPTFDKYEYLQHGVEFAKEGVDDAANWLETTSKMGVLGVEADEKTCFLKILSGVLAIGNLGFNAKPGGGADDPMLPSDDKLLARVASLFGVDATALATKLTSRQVTAGGESYTVALKPSQCLDARDALAQGLYVSSFEWLVMALNRFQKKDDASRVKCPGDEERFIGLLDIFGFENFRKNSFEQLCINFTNERLQAHFMDALVKLRMVEYESEGVPVSAIDFPDNEAQIGLIDGKREGIFAALDDECSVPKGAEQSFVDKLHALFSKGKPKASHCYDKLKRAKGGKLVGEASAKEFESLGTRELDELSFVVVHYAEPVKYTADGWLDKNRGYLHPELAFVLSQSASTLVRELYPASACDVAKKSSVSSTFRKSLRALSATMLQTSQWYVRCIKPNGVRKPDQFEGHFVLRQLRYTGVASVVEIQRSGYPISISHGDFLSRYRCIALERPALCKELTQAAPEACKALLRAGPEIAKIEPVDWMGDLAAVVGKTRVFMKDLVVRALEAPRLEAATKATLVMQRFARVTLARLLFKILVMHVPAAAEVRKAIAALDPILAGERLDALASQWSAAKLPLRWIPLVEECKAEKEELAGEVRARSRRGLWLHADGPRSLHADLRASLHADRSPSLHADLRASLHADLPSSLHADLPLSLIGSSLACLIACRCARSRRGSRPSRRRSSSCSRRSTRSPTAPCRPRRRTCCSRWRSTRPRRRRGGCALSSPRRLRRATRHCRRAWAIWGSAGSNCPWR